MMITMIRMMISHHKHDDNHGWNDDNRCLMMIAITCWHAYGSPQGVSLVFFRIFLFTEILMGNFNTPFFITQLRREPRDFLKIFLILADFESSDCYKNNLKDKMNHKG